MFPIFADSFLTAARLSQPNLTPDYRLLHPDRRLNKAQDLPRLWFWLS